MNIKIKGEVFILWRAIDSEGHELEVLLQKRRNKKSAIRFLSRWHRQVNSNLAKNKYFVNEAMRLAGHKIYKNSTFYG